MDNQTGLSDQFATKIVETSVQTGMCLIWEFASGKIKPKKCKEIVYFQVLAVRLEGMRECALFVFVTYLQGHTVKWICFMERFPIWSVVPRGVLSKESEAKFTIWIQEQKRISSSGISLNPNKSQDPSVNFQVCPLSLRSHRALAPEPKQQVTSDGGWTEGEGNSAKQEKAKTSRRK